MWKHSPYLCRRNNKKIFITNNLKPKKMKNLVIISNHGNHSGFNVKWTIAGKFDNLKEAKALLLNIAFNVSDDVIEENGLPFNINGNEVVYDGDSDSFNYDGKKYVIITQEDYENGIFDGRGYGYASNEIIDFFEEK